MKSFRLLALSLVTIFLIGCGNILSPSHAPANSTAVKQPTESKQLVAESITAEPSGILIRISPGIGTQTNIIENLHITPGHDSQMPQLSFNLNHVSKGPHIILNQSQPVWNQTLANIEVRQIDDHLNVTVSYTGLSNQVKVSTADKYYLGISFVHDSDNLPPVNEHGVLPFWFLRDLTIANRLQYIPTTMDEYGQPLPLKTEARDMLAAPYNGTSEALGYGSYFGAIHISDLYRNFNSEKASGFPISMRSGYILEHAGNHLNHVHAYMLEMGNGWSLGFANHQVIIETEKSGMLGYSVYKAPGISIPAAFSKSSALL